MTTETIAPAENDFDWTGSMGADAAQEAAQRAGSGFNRTEYFSLKDYASDKVGGVAIVRFLTDVQPVPGSPVPWITVLQHSNVSTKPKPAGHEGNWPAKMSAVCRADRVFARKYPDGCFICENFRVTEGKNKGKPWPASPRTWALVILREEVMEGGQIIGIRDKTKEIKRVQEGKETGEVVTVKDIRLVNLGYKNFFGILQGLAGRWGTVLDRDIEIKRFGTDTTTEYKFSPLDPIELEPGKRFDLRDPEQMAQFYPDVPDLRELVARNAGDEYYNRFFIPGADDSTPAANGSNGSAPSAPAPTRTDAEADALAALANRVTAYGAGGSQEAQGAPADQSAPAGPRRAL